MNQRIDDSAKNNEMCERQSNAKHVRRRKFRTHVSILKKQRREAIKCIGEHGDVSQPGPDPNAAKKRACQKQRNKCECSNRKSQYGFGL